ncbi:MAG TPA: type II secretion system F family protein [Syntrophorhabdales bacterium]|nr:type II secretion system F family protein [Syntrophorhabdales bacterium]
MAVFAYKARDERGALIAGTMDADSHRAVSAHLDSMGLFPVAVSEKKGFGTVSLDEYLTKLDRVKLDDLIFFTRQLRTVIKAGVPLISGLKALEEQTNSRKLKKKIKKVWQDLDRGQSFSDALSGNKDVFSDLYVSMVKAGEVGGVLDEVLERLAQLLEFQMKTRETFKSAMRYPSMVVGAIVIAFGVLVTFVIPKFALLFKGSTMQLPLPTRILLGLNDLVQAYGVFLLGGVIGICIAGYVYTRTQQGKYVRDQLMLKLPIVGKILLKICMSRFAYVEENLIRAGVPIVTALEIVARTVGNLVITKKVVEISEKIEKGKGISKPMKDSGIFPPLVLHLIATGEDTGSLEEMLREVSIHYDSEVTYSLNRLSSWIEPILITVLGGMVLFIALAVFLPWWSMMEAMKHGGG